MTISIDEALSGRRSVRSYEERDVPEELIKEIIKAATLAPSAKNGQQWRFTVLRRKSKKDFTDLYRKELDNFKYDVGSSYGSLQMMEKVPVVIIVWNTAEMGWVTEIHSVAASIQNLLLKAYALGLGTCWIGDIFYAEKAIEKHFKKPWKLTAAITVGWPKVVPKPRPRLSVDEVTEFLD